MRRISLSVASLLCTLFAPPGAVVALAGESLQPVTLMVYPERISLNSMRDRQGIVVQAKFADGSTRDVSAVADLQVAGTAVARIRGPVLEPLTEGESELGFQWNGVRRNVKIEVAGLAHTAPLRFRNDVLPILTRAGCNTGKCHGSASGKDGFRLSLFGYDPSGDHYRLTREMSGRRINLADPEECLLINKSLGKVPHTGGQRIDPASDHCRTLLSWLEAGAEPDPP